ncbi:hypothetical protein Pmani_035693 [Petrolisthes manimaculis]|uniref:Uncharacterized protein n=1 Tax=Petrolisthes manimaculis TaxID=1843537 RepID=A0AAE1NK27_9EUCA|nr:hypothetical protein Pmani_035693 [Petrolisthes manimaculis]
MSTVRAPSLHLSCPGRGFVLAVCVFVLLTDGRCCVESRKVNKMNGRMKRKREFNSVKNNRINSEEEDAGDCKEEKESDQNVDIEVKQKEKEVSDNAEKKQDKKRKEE